MITLLSDFGAKDTYVAVMKGAIASIAPQDYPCDLTHEVPPQSILAARFHLMLAYPYFPSGTVHLAVVDPGVGSARRAIALECPSGFLVGPDNGLFSGILQQEPAITAVALTNRRYWRTLNPSHTFHGRDIFAPAAAHLANGVPIAELGDRIEPASLVQPELPPVISLAGQPADNQAMHFPIQYAGSLQHIDHFGNLIGNLPGNLLPAGMPAGAWQVAVKTPNKQHCLLGVKTYSDVPAGQLAAFVGSHGWIEVACNGSSAARLLDLSLGSAVEILLAFETA